MTHQSPADPTNTVTGTSVPAPSAEDVAAPTPEQTPQSPVPAAPADEPLSPATAAQAAETTAVATTDQSVEKPEPEPQPEPAPAGSVAPAVRSLSYAVDIVFCIDVTGSMNPVLDAVKTNALKFYDDVEANLTDKGKHVDELRVRVVAFRDFSVNQDNALVESAFFSLPGERIFFDQFVNGLVAEGGGDAPESGLEAVALAVTSPWTKRGDRRRQVIVVWTDQPAHPLDPTVLPPDLAGSVPADFDALTDLWEDAQGLLGPSSKRLILFAPDGPGWSDISANWENVVHHPSQAGGGLSEVDYGTIIVSIGNSV